MEGRENRLDEDYPSLHVNPSGFPIGHFGFPFLEDGSPFSCFGWFAALAPLSAASKADTLSYRALFLTWYVVLLSFRKAIAFCSLVLSSMSWITKGIACVVPSLSYAYILFLWSLRMWIHFANLLGSCPTTTSFSSNTYFFASKDFTLACKYWFSL